MAAAVHVSPASGSITHLVDAVRVTVTGASSNDATAYNVNVYPTEPAIEYTLQFVKAGQDTLKSPVFTPAEDGTAEWNGVILPAAGTWTLNLVDAVPSTIATASVVVA